MDLSKLILPEEFYNLEPEEKRGYKKSLTYEENLVFTTNLAEWNIKDSFGIEINGHEKWMLRLYLKASMGKPYVWDFFQESISKLLFDYFDMNFSDFFPKEEGMLRYPQVKEYLHKRSSLWRDERELL